MSPKKPGSIIPHVGGAVSGDRRFARPDLEGEFDHAMKTGNGARLFGLRKIGKSTEALACCERLKKSNQQVVWVDAEGMTSEAQLLIEIMKDLPDKEWFDKVMEYLGHDNALSKTARRALERALGGKSPGDLQDYFETISAAIERVIPKANGVVLIIDEFPWLCQNILDSDENRGCNRVNVLLAVLRKWRDAGMRMLLLGSIGLVRLAREYHFNLGLLSDTITLNITPLGQGEARIFISSLALGGRVTGWTGEHTEELLKESATWYPSFLQRAFQQLTIGNRAAELDHIARIFSTRIRPDLDQTFYMQFYDRTKRYRDLPEPLPGLLLDLLQLILDSDAPVSHQELQSRSGRENTEEDFADALVILWEDGFISVCIERDYSHSYSSASNLVTGWWKQRRGGR